ncbi:MAG: hypothetical protein QMD04_11825 [Anaerolineales bacterium]|nr:hypothetical protein [Anaerolineales bacterium]
MKTRVYSKRLDMKHNLPVVMLILILLASGCNAGAPGLDSSAQAWVEYPYEGSILPMGPVVLVIYAADPGGISYIHIKINGQSLPAYAASPMTTDGSARLVRIDYPWTPPAEGEYRVEAAGVNAAGASGAFGSTRFCIVTCVPIPSVVDPPTDTPAPAPGPTDTPIITDTPTPTLTLTSPPPLPNVTVSFFAEPPYVNAGNCSTLRWAVTGTNKVYLNGSLVPATSNQQRCPCESETHTLRVIGPDGTPQDYYARIDVYGSCYTPPPTTETPPVDSTGPTINSFGTFWEGCSIYGQASISDPSGVTWAEFWYNLKDQGWAWLLMNQSGGDWVSQVGIETGGSAGSLQYKIRTLDTYHNETWSNVKTKNFAYCGD